MKKISIAEKKLDIISDYVSSVVSQFIDDFMVEGAYVSFRAVDDNLTDVFLRLVYIDYRFNGDYPVEELKQVIKATGINISVGNVSYARFSDNQNGIFDYPYKSELKNADIIFDRNGYLKERQRLCQLDSFMDDMEWAGIVIPEKPIQYKKVL